MSKSSERAAKRAAKLAAAAAAAAAVTPDVPVSPAPETTPPAVPAPLRASVGNASHVDVAAVPAILMYLGRHLNGIGTPSKRDTCTVGEPLALTVDDAPLLYARAAVLLAAASSATVNAPNRIGASPLDRMQFLARAAERCIYTADRIRDGVRPVRAFSGGFNGTEPTRIRIASLLSVSDLPALTDIPVPYGDVPSADAVDPLVVAHLAARKTATRPDGGYFAVNVGTIDR